MTFLRRHAMLLLALLTSIMLALVPAAGMASDYTIGEMGDALREAQAAFDAADEAYDALCEEVFELNERYEKGSESEKLKVQDALLEAMIVEEEAYAVLDECTADLEALKTIHDGMVKDSRIKEKKLSAKGYDSKLTIHVWLDDESVIWDVAVDVDGNEKDMAVGEDSFLVQFIGRQLPLTTDKKDEECIILLSDAKKTSQAVVDALNTLAKKDSGAKKSQPAGPIIEPQAIADYIFEYGRLPDNFITKKEAQKLGWDSSWNYVSDVAPGMSIGGDRFGNYEGRLPEKKGRQWYEADCYYTKGKRNAHRILYSNDGLVYYTDDHYETFTQMFPSGK